jgi:hypothetical protein
VIFGSPTGGTSWMLNTGLPSAVAALAGATTAPLPCVYWRCRLTHELLSGKPDGLSSRVDVRTAVFCPFSV